MRIVKYAAIEENINIHSASSALSNPNTKTLLLNPKASQEDEKVKNRFIKFAATLRAVARKSNDFLFFSCIMMHSAEASLIDQASGEWLKNKEGKPLTSEWVINKKTGSWKWKCSDSNIKPYRNNNGDIFPEEELKKAYRKWVGRPLCKDHQSSSVDGIRGIIVDTYYDDTKKRVIALCALDKVNYPDLARKVSTGYATNVSMGTAVGQSICFECGNVAKVEADYCPCVQKKCTYGEINIDLSPIELSLVVTGADPKAQLRSVIASLNQYSVEKKERIQELRSAGCVTPGELERLEKEITALSKSVAALQSIGLKKEGKMDREQAELISNIGRVLGNISNPETRAKLEKIIDDLAGSEVLTEEVSAPYGQSSGKKEMTGGGAGFMGDSTSGPPPYTFDHKETRVASDINVALNTIGNKLDAMEHALHELKEGVQPTNYITKEEDIMSDAKLVERARARRAMFQKAAYHQGGGGLNEPQTYPVDPLNDQLKTKGDKQMEGQGMEPGNDGLHPGYQSYGSDLELKKKLSRAELEQRKLRRQALLSNANQYTKVGDTPDGQEVLYNPVTKETRVVNKAQDADTPNPDRLAHYLEEAEARAQEATKQAYWQGGGGVNEPQTYPVDPLNDQLKTKGDKQMEGQGMEPGNDGMHPGYQSYGNELELKKKHLRADLNKSKLRAKFIVAFKDENGAIIDKENSRWEIYAGPKKVLSATGKEIYEDELEERWEILASKRYGREVLRAIREEGLEKVAGLLKGDEFVKTAQPPMPPMPEGPEGPGPAGPAELEAPEGPELGDSDPKSALEKLDSALKEAEGALSDLQKYYEKEGEDDSAELPSASGEEANDADDEMAADDGEQEASAEAADTVSDTYAALDESADELAMLAESLQSRIKAGKTGDDPVTAELLRLTNEALKENAELCSEASLIVKAAKKDDKDEDDKDDKKEKKEKKEDKDDKKEKKEKKEDKKDKDEEDDGKKSKAHVMLENLLRARATKRRELLREASEGEDMGSSELDKVKAELADLKSRFADWMKEEAREPYHTTTALEVDEPVDEEDDTAEGFNAEDLAMDAQLAQLLDEGLAEEEVMVDDLEADDATEGFGLSTDAAARRAWRERVAAEVGAKYQLKLDPQTTADTDMPLGESANLGQLDTSPSDDGAKVEGLAEQHEKILREVYNLPKVREAMEHLVKLMKVGALDANDLENADKLKALAVDPAAAKYYKDYFGQADQESRKFADELTKEYSKKKVEASLDEQKVKMRRAYEMALEMQDKGLIPEDSNTLHKQVDEIMGFDNKSFESFKRALNRVSGVTKTASINTTPAIQVGVNTDGLNRELDAPVSLSSQLKRLW